MIKEYSEFLNQWDVIEDMKLKEYFQRWKFMNMPTIPVELLDGFEQEHRWLCFGSRRQFIMSSTQRMKSEYKYHFPWANLIAYVPHNTISNTALIQQGFIIGWYITKSKDYIRIAGIDGGGYNFDHSHMMPLMIQVNEELGNSLETDDGWQEITLEDRDKHKMPKRCGQLLEYTYILRGHKNGNLVEEWQNRQQ